MRRDASARRDGLSPETGLCTPGASWHTKHWGNIAPASSKFTFRQRRTDLLEASTGVPMHTFSNSKVVSKQSRSAGVSCGAQACPIARRLRSCVFQVLEDGHTCTTPRLFHWASGADRFARLTRKRVEHSDGSHHQHCSAAHALMGWATSGYFPTSGPWNKQKKAPWPSSVALESLIAC
jgi:hypothetical protein